MKTARESLRLSKINEAKQLKKISKERKRRYKFLIKTLKKDIKIAISCGNFGTKRFVNLGDLDTMIIEYFASKGYKVTYERRNVDYCGDLTISWDNKEEDK